MLVGASCTAELIQDDPGGLAKALGLPIPVVPLELPVLPEARRTGARRRPSTSWCARSPARTRRARHRRARGPARARAATSSAPRRSASATATTSPRSRGLLDRLGIDVQRRRAAGRHAGRPRPPRRGRLQRRALSRDRARRRRAGCSAPSASRATRTVPIGVGATRDFIAEVAALAGLDAAPVLADDAVAAALVLALGRFDLPHRQARLHLRRRHPCHRRGPHRRDGARLHGRRARHLQPRVRPRGPRGRQALRRRGADHRRLSRGRGQGRRAAARAGARHADGAPHRQAPGHPLRGDLGPGACAGLPGPLLAADGLRGRQRPLRHLGPSADDGPGGASARHVPRGLRVPRRRRAVASRRSRRAAPRAAAAPRPRRAARAGRRPAWAAEAEKELQQDPVLRARQGAPQHRALRRASAASPRSPSRPCTMPKPISAAEEAA